jgi:Fe(3+) dicitrate transport protein
MSGIFLRSGSADVNIMNNTRVMESFRGAGLNYNFNDRSGIYLPGSIAVLPLPGSKMRLPATERISSLTQKKAGTLNLAQGRNFSDFLVVELTFFNMDFSNQVIPVSESSGGRVPDILNGGRTSHRGIETELRMNISDID